MCTDALATVGPICSPGFDPSDEPALRETIELVEPLGRIDNTGEFSEPSTREGTTEQDSIDFAAEFTAASGGPSNEARGVDADESTETTQAEAGGSAEPAQTTGGSAETTESKTGDPSNGRERAYLEERNSVLSAKLDSGRRR